ncbi:GNAT family N-acetyltransferase [Mucilaginibacter sp. Mucisp86]|uniref:GNAT family N-acetyltransferase n=1 Tax=Mucilaginibacter sp. Mucisp86 TaxID=3243060 RepID=UPI0039B3EC41
MIEQGSYLKSKIFDLMNMLVNDESGLFEVGDLDSYIDKLIEKACIITIMEQDVLHGFLAYYANDYNNKVGFISMLIVDPSTKRMGYGRRLVEFALKDLTLKGFEKCRTEVNADNIKAVNICKRLGFTYVGKNDIYLVFEKQL